MQLPTTLLLLLSAGALRTTLALPTATDTLSTNSPPADEVDSAPESLFNETTSDLEKRSNYGWLSSYGATDYNCKGGHSGPRPKIHNDCIKFHPSTDIVGISWGTWPLRAGGLAIFTDDNCKQPAGPIIKAPAFDSAEGPGSCVSVRMHGAKWGSVKDSNMVGGEFGK